MDPFHFACPHCLSPLRVREKLFVGRQVDCPECGDLLLIVERAAGGMQVERIERKTDVSAAAQKDQSQSGKLQPGRQHEEATKVSAPQAIVRAVADDSPKTATGIAPPSQGIPFQIVSREFLADSNFWHMLLSRRPVIAGLVAAMFLAGGLCVWVLFRFTDGISDRTEASSADVAANITAINEAPPRPVADDAPPANTEKPRDDLESRLAKIGEALLAHVAAEKAFPAAVVPERSLLPENRLSWMAVIADRLDNDSAPAPIWDRPWNDPQNDPFVRRRLTVFQNPSIGQLTGADGYPAAHFVGVAGVGADAAKLDPLDPRAGIFNNSRATRIEDVTDGVSNTLLVMGVRDHIGSWAAGGSSSVRGLTREPYVNGPDGFGTGQADSMLVLMADGSVRTIGSGMDSRLLRRMAAKADGLALDVSEPGEPGERLAGIGERFGDPLQKAGGRDAILSSAGGFDDAVLGASRNIDRRPIDPEFVPEPGAGGDPPPVREFDLAAALKQPIARFDQPRSKSLEDVLISVAEMAGTQIAFNRDELGPAAARLREPATLAIENTTVGEILSSLLRPAGLAFRIEGNRLRLVRAEQ